MTFVKTHVIEGFCPLSHGEKEWVRTHLKLTAVKNFPVTGIHSKAVKHMVTEMYAATASQFKKGMAAEVGGMPLLHLSLDLWVDKFSSLKYIGKKNRVVTSFLDCRERAYWYCLLLLWLWYQSLLPAMYVLRRFEKDGKVRVLLNSWNDYFSFFFRHFVDVHSFALSLPKTPAPGIRLFYIDRSWVLRSRLIAVRQFNPTKELLESNRLSGLLEEYLKSVLEEYGLDTTLLFSATSDAGSGVKRLCKVLLPGLWEWCVCHMINCALVEVSLRWMVVFLLTQFRCDMRSIQILGSRVTGCCEKRKGDDTKN